MAEALIRITDTKKGQIELEVKFSPAIDNESPAHQLVAKVVELAGLEKVTDESKPAEV